jgi:hypothetical protein
MDALTPRLQGFLEALAAISSGQYDQGGLVVTYPARFDRDNLEVVWYSGSGTQRSGGFFVKTEISGIAEFFDQALQDPSHPFAESRKELAEKFIALVEQELSPTALEFWYNDGGHNATLSVCLSLGAEETWLELFWSID